VDLATADGSGIEVEQRGAHEVAEFHGVPVAPLGAQAYNPAFDVTPPDLITAIVTEKGVVSPVDGGALETCAAGHDPVMRR
jgi:methylthioribose-1-phosphate isomerase